MAYRKKKRDEQHFHVAGELLFLCGAFLIGALIGSIFASIFESALPSAFYSIIDGSSSPSFKAFFLTNAFLLLVIFISAFVRYGLAAIPLTIATKGFSVSVAVTSYIKFYGIKGYLPALFSLFFTSFIVVLALILLSCQALEYSKAVSRKGSGAAFGRLRFDRGYFFSAVVSLLLIFIAELLYCYLMPIFTLMTISFIQ
ncbi:MAG: hypothetical protein VB078_10645 [Clostridiaceae bacterium]|nr:hypothetical protein [Clostridiaceae bacterium]